MNLIVCMEKKLNHLSFFKITNINDYLRYIHK